MVALREIIDVHELNTLQIDGFVSCRPHPDDNRLVIANYTPKAVTQEWTTTLRACRGLIYRNDLSGEGHLVARGPAKFFNSTESESEGILHDPDQHIVVTDKADGSLGILYEAPDGLPAIATRGSFASDQAIHATEVLRSRYLEAATQAMGYGWTPVFEIIYPDNRIVVDYGSMDDLMLIGWIDAHGNTFPASQVKMRIGYPWPVVETIFEGKLIDFTFTDRPGKEGVVVNAVPGMVKLKQADYVAIHRAVFGLSEYTVWSLRDDQEGFDALCDRIPVEHADWARGTMLRLTLSMLAFWQDAHEAALVAVHGLADDDPHRRRKIAQRLSQGRKDVIAGAWFAVDNHMDRLNEWAWKQVQPRKDTRPSFVGDPE